MTIINRVWAMPSPNTFEIGPIAELIKKYNYKRPENNLW